MRIYKTENEEDNELLIEILDYTHHTDDIAILYNGF